MTSNVDKQNRLSLIPKSEQYIEYMIKIIIKLPRIEKYSIGNEYKTSMYQMLEQIMYLNKIKEKQVITLNKIDVKLNCQRIYLRIMKENHWIDERKFNIAMEKIYEIGKILGGLMKYYAKNNSQ